MKRILSITSIAAVAFTGTSSAIERLTPIQEPKVVPSNKPAETASKAWLGVGGKPVSEALAAQLNVPNGVTVELVAPEGSAAKAGIRKFDVITKVAATPIKGMHDLRAVMSQSQVDDIIDVEVFSAGKLAVKKVKLGARPAHLPQVSTTPQPRVQPQQMLQKFPHTFQHLPSADQQRIEQMMQAQIQQMQERFAQMDADVHNIQKLHQGAMQLDPQDMRFKGHSHYSGTFTMMDDHGSIRLTVNDESGKHVEVKDKQGKVLYEGPYETDEDKKAVPADVKERIEALGVGQANRAGGLKFRFGR